MADDSLMPRLLSHRLRGFDSVDSTRHGLERGLAAGVRHVEFDVRFTADGWPVVYHDPFFKADDGSWQYIHAWDHAVLRRQETMSRMATLEDMCATFAERRTPDALIHVDVKVAGREEAVYAMLAKFGLLPHTVLVSWLPSVLVRFNTISPQTPLCFSHITAARFPWIYAPMKWFCPAARHLAAPILSKLVGRRFAGIVPRRALAMMTACYHFHDSGDPARHVGSDDQADCVDGHVVPSLLTGQMRELLRKTNGIVCVPTSLATRRLGDEYRSRGIRLAVFSVVGEEALKHVLTEISPELIYVDDAKLFKRHPNAQFDAVAA
jgi:Glycerophosphoryl diester phosphodiesterase family